MWYSNSHFRTINNVNIINKITARALWGVDFVKLRSRSGPESPAQSSKWLQTSAVLAWLRVEDMTDWGWVEDGLRSSNRVGWSKVVVGTNLYNCRNLPIKGNWKSQVKEKILMAFSKPYLIHQLVVLSEENRVPVPHLWERNNRSFPTKAGNHQYDWKEI